MPEGPTLVILKEEVQPFKKKKVIAAAGNAKINIDDLKGQVITDFKTWGKHFLICFPETTIRVHFLLFGSYKINERKEAKPRLQLTFKNGEINFYASSIVELEKNLDDIYDWSVDVLNKKWNPRKARASLKKVPNKMVCDALLDQTIFSGVGNIIKNEVLFRIRVHPESTVGSLPPAKLSALIKEARNYSYDFLKWKKEFTLKKHWLIYTKKTCPRCNIPAIKKNTGKTNRRSFFCTNCQKLYKKAK